MEHMVMTIDGKSHYLFDEGDVLSLIEEYAGSEVKQIVEYLLITISEFYDIDYLQYLVDSTKEHHKDIMIQLREISEEIATLICQKKIDRRKLSAAAGKIGKITWQEINA